jgi:hypothetical protein
MNIQDNIFIQQFIADMWKKHPLKLTEQKLKELLIFLGEDPSLYDLNASVLWLEYNFGHCCSNRYVKIHIKEYYLGDNRCD